MKKLLVPDGMKKHRTELPLGAPPVDVPRFDKIQPTAQPKQMEEQLPQQEKIKRSPEEIKADFQKIAQISAEPPKEEIVENDGPTLGELPDFNWEAYSNAQEESDFRRPEIKKAIEDRNPEISVDDLILYESVDQRQIIVPGKLEVVFRSLTAAEDLAIKDYIYRVIGSQRYVVDMLTLMTLTCGLKTFNDAEIPDHMKIENGERIFDDKRFEEKLKIVKSLGIQVVGLLSIVYMWFDQNIRKQLVVGILGKS